MIRLDVCSSNSRSPISGPLCPAAKNDDFVADVEMMIWKEGGGMSWSEDNFTPAIFQEGGKPQSFHATCNLASSFCHCSISAFLCSLPYI